MNLNQYFDSNQFKWTTTEMYIKANRNQCQIKSLKNWVSTWNYNHNVHKQILVWNIIIFLKLLMLFFNLTIHGTFELENTKIAMICNPYWYTTWFCWTATPYCCWCWTTTCGCCCWTTTCGCWCWTTTALGAATGCIGLACWGTWW